MANTWISDLIGTSAGYIKLALTGVRLKNVSGNLAVRNSGDTADAEVTASKVNISGNDLVINSDAAGSGADWSITLARPTSGMTASYTFTYPVNDGSPNQVLQTDGSGNTSWVDGSGSTADKIGVDSTALAFGSSATVAMFTLPANAVILAIEVVIDTAFNGTPSMSVGISGTTSKYMASTQVGLTEVAETVFKVHPAKAPVGTTEDLIISYTAGGASAGAARVLTYYVIPS